ncbi:MAG TPA: (d)CMP kinase [Firmicutes bacterium]|nr:(d)CMP kinase [Bacillota bacterium]
MRRNSLQRRVGGDTIKPTVAIDGPAGAGKSTVAKLVAERLQLDYLDTGAMYRAVTYFALAQNVDVHDEKALEKLMASMDMEVSITDGKTIIIVNGEDVTDYLRQPAINAKVSYIASSPAVRWKLVSLQRQLGEQGGIIMDGRDIGSNVLTKAPYKFFLTADLRERARRRYLEFKENNIETTLEDVEKEIARRDEIDKNREIDPLVIPADGLVVDTTSMSIEEVADFICSKITGKGV